MCGSIFCGACSASKLLLPPKFREGAPQRTCVNCAALLAPLQPFLAGAEADFDQTPGFGQYLDPPELSDMEQSAALRNSSLTKAFSMFARGI